MALIKSVRGFTPKFGENCFLAENATIIGNVVMGNDCSVWFNTVIRGDVNSIKIGNLVNIQDGSVLHTLYEKSTIEIGNNVSIGHNVTIHGAKICDNVLVGMGSVILDHAVIGENSIIAGSLYAGVPAKKIKNVSPEQTKEMIYRISHNYRMYADWYKES